MNNKNLLGNLILTFVAIIWGTAFVFQRVGMEHIEPVTFTASRMTLAAVVVGVFAVFKSRLARPGKEAASGPEFKFSLIGGSVCGFFLATASIFQQAGIVTTTAGKAGFITAMYILIVPVLNLVLFKKKNTWIVWLAVMIGVFGMYLLCIKEGFSLSHGDFLVLICALLFSGHILCCDHFSKKGDPINIAAVQFAVTAIISWIAAFVIEAPDTEKIISALVPIIYCGLISGGLGYTLQIVGQKYTDPTIASLLMSLESVFAVLAGTLFLGERMSVKELIECIVMFIAILMVQIPLPGKTKDAS